MAPHDPRGGYGYSPEKKLHDEKGSLLILLAFRHSDMLICLLLGNRLHMQAVAAACIGIPLPLPLPEPCYQGCRIMCNALLSTCAHRYLNALIWLVGEKGPYRRVLPGYLGIARKYCPTNPALPQCRDFYGRKAAWGKFWASHGCVSP